VKPHPRIRKAVKWGGVVVSVGLVAAWVVSGWWSVVWWSKRGDCAGIAMGGVLIGRVDYDVPAKDRGLNIDRALTKNFQWWFWAGGHNRPSTWQVMVPLWVPAGVAMAAAAGAWRLDALARRRARVGFCCGCGYDRAGLAAGAVCPECGVACVAEAGGKKPVETGCECGEGGVEERGAVNHG
jgi:hypothetical protein